MAPVKNGADSLRHYLLRHRKIEPRLKAEVILAEEANQLYRDTNYRDLITFEEDIARISAMVLLIAESAGSLAELGAFAASDTIRQSLAILMQAQYERAESFVRHGPVAKIREEDEGRVAFYPWALNGKGRVIRSSVKHHVSNVVKFINARLDKVPQEELFRGNSGLQKFLSLYWILNLSQALATSELHSYATSLGIETDLKDVKNKLFCMKMAGWVDTYAYSNKTYWYTLRSQDPFARYSFKDGVQERDTVRRKAAVTTAIHKELDVPRHVREYVVKKRKP